MTGLTVKPSAELQAEIDSDWGDLPKKISPIVCRVGQPTSRGGAKIGMFNYQNKPDWEPSDKIEHVVLLKAVRTRVLYGPTFESPARCGSDNFNFPSSRIKNPISNSCNHCPASQWVESLDNMGYDVREQLIAELKPKKTGNAPLCATTYNLIVVDKRMFPFVLQAQRTQIKNVDNNLINRLRFSGQRIFAQAFDISLRKMETADGSWYEYSFDNFRQTENVDEYQKFHSMFKTSGEQVLAEQHAAMDAEKLAAQPQGANSEWQDEEIPF